MPWRLWSGCDFRPVPEADGGPVRGFIVCDSALGGKVTVWLDMGRLKSQLRAGY